MSNSMRAKCWSWLFCLLSVAFGGFLYASKIAATPGTSRDDEWPYYGHDAGGMRYSPLQQINRENVSHLKMAWTFHTGDISDGHGRRKRSGFETTPLLVDGTLYLTTPFNRVIALDPATGKQRWEYDPKIALDGDYGDGLVNRGVATWLDVARANGQSCRRRIFESTQDARLLAIDAATGAPCPDFGKAGQVSLRDVPRYDAGWYHMTSPPAVIDDLVIVGSAIDDNHRVDMARGVVRAYDARTGALRWSWDPLPPNPASANTDSRAKVFRSGAGNAWSVMAVDAERDLLFAPTGSPSPDYYGGLRVGDDKWANSVVALRAKTGEFVWGFQLVHHDLWDFDSASPPLLTTLRHDGQDVPVVIQGNKSGMLYVLNRDTGKPVFPVEERPVPQSDVPGEVTSPTQPFPLAPPPLAAHTLSPADAWGPTPEDREACRKAMAPLRNEGIFTPPSLQGTLMVPGNIGGMTWSGYAFDPQKSLLVTNTNNLVAWARLIPRVNYDQPGAHDNEDADHGDQIGSPYGMARRFLQSFRSPVQPATLGPAHGSRHDRRKDSLASAAWLDAGFWRRARAADSAWIDQPRWTDYYRRRRRIHRRHHRLLHPRLRHRNWKGIVEGATSRKRKRYTHDLPSRKRRKTISSDRRGRARKDFRRKARRRANRLYASVTGSLGTPIS
jgi:quinoprotein glucose dehydrogenase